jgi:hypothetical protein
VARAAPVKKKLGGGDEKMTVKNFSLGEVMPENWGDAPDLRSIFGVIDATALLFQSVTETRVFTTEMLRPEIFTLQFPFAIVLVVWPLEIFWSSTRASYSLSCSQ